MTRHQTAQQIADRVLIKGFKCEIKLSDHVITSSHSHFGDDKKRAFMNQKLTGDLTVDFTGIGPASLANLAAVGITNSDGLFAAFLSIIDNPNPMANTDKCDQFYEQLGRWKVASGYKATIIYQLQSKLAVGIDSSHEGELEMALRNYEAFHRIPSGSATVGQLQSSSAKIGGWLRAGQGREARASEQHAPVSGPPVACRRRMRLGVPLRSFGEAGQAADEATIEQLLRDTADPLPLAPGEWQGPRAGLLG